MTFVNDKETRFFSEISGPDEKSYHNEVREGEERLELKRVMI